MSQPTNIPSEFRFLAGLCQNPHSYFDYAEHISTDDFTYPAHSALFIILQNIAFSNEVKENIAKHAILAKAAELGIKDFYELSDNGELLDACLEQKISQDDLDESFYQLKKETTRRKLIKSFTETVTYLRDPGDDNVNTLIGKVENNFINSLNKLAGVTDNKLIELNNEAFDIIDKLSEKPGDIGLNLDFPLFQRGIGGIRNGSVTFIAASAKSGKSMLGMHACLKAAQKGLPVLYCDSELNIGIQSVRAVGGYLGINFDILETGYWTKSKEDIVKAGYSEQFAHYCELAAHSLKQTNIREKFKSLNITYLSINGMTVQEALPLMRRWVLQKVGLCSDIKQPSCLIVFDYIKLARLDEIQGGKLGVHDVLGAAAGGLHDFAEKYHLPIIAFGQTNRMQYNEGINCIAGAKKLVELTDSCSMLRVKNEEQLLTYPKGTHALDVLVSRHGAGLRSHIDLETNLGIAHFKEIGLGSANIINIPQDNKDGQQNNQTDSKPKYRKDLKKD